MSTLDLNLLFPAPQKASLVRGPLPKQQEFLDAALDPKGPKYLAYFGGYGSGKSLVLCITMIIQGILFGGEYVIARHFMPELRRTTMKLFLELLPKELLLELRVADAEIHIKSTKGKAIFYFVGLDSPEKLDSLTLDGAAVDEASQITKEAFLKIMGRIRGLKGLRKILLVGNPRGHDYVYEYFIKQDCLTDQAKTLYKLIVAPTLENKHLTEDYVQGMLSSYSKERIQRDIMGSFDVFEGQILSEFRRDTHVIPSFEIPQEWTKIIGIDHGFTNQAAWIYGAVDYDGNIYIYSEYYKTEKLIKEICQENLKFLGKNYKKVAGAFIDPSTKAARGQTGASDWDSYLDNLPKDFPLMPAKNEVEAGIDKVKTYLRIQGRTGKPKLFIFDNCVNLIEEMVQYRYEELGPSQEGRRNQKESPRKYKDHAVDALRYLIMSRPTAPKVEDKEQKNVEKAMGLEGSVQRELYRIRHPQNKDPFEN